ncbi:hypothetical protein ACHAW6_009766, partial [Cyclotella cf. meneghiniana]
THCCRCNKHDRDDNSRKKSRETKSSYHAAPSDYTQLCSHFQFVLPEEDDDNSKCKNYGSTWQRRMVLHYHSHLYKEYVLADLSRVLKGGRIGLQWRTEREVKSGIGFQTCGNVACLQQSNEIPTGVFLPSEEASNAIECYLCSCEKEERRDRKKRECPERKKKLQDYNTSRGEDDSIQGKESRRRETKEQKRLARVPHGIGLHDYEVDFAYVEHNQQKRELVKVRLCLRCAPLIFSGKNAATKARLAREKAAMEAIADSGDNRHENIHDNTGNNLEEHNFNQSDNNVDRKKCHDRRHRKDGSKKRRSKSLSSSSDRDSYCSSYGDTSSLPSINREEELKSARKHLKKRRKKT